MKPIINLSISACILFLAACTNEPSNEEKAAAAKQKVDNAMKADKAAHMNIAGLNIQPEDPYCNMPITAGITDTATVRSKLYGFCSKECKEEFLKEQNAKKQ